MSALVGTPQSSADDARSQAEHSAPTAAVRSVFATPLQSHELSDDTKRLVECDALRAEVVMGRARGENVPVATRILPRQFRQDLLAVYGFARLVDQIGDDAPGDRGSLLDALERDLEQAYSGWGWPRHPLLRSLVPTIRRRQIPAMPFRRLIEANRLDQKLTRIATWEELLAYCQLSANPVGELVLYVFGQASRANIEKSNAVCSALQVVEHCQDVAEDLAQGRTYLPASDLDAQGCAVDALDSVPAPEAMRRVVSLQVGRARELLRDATPLVHALRGWARPVVAAYAGGGLATCDALTMAGFDPNSTPVRPRKSRLLVHTLALLMGRGGST